MLKKSFLGLARPRIEFEVLPEKMPQPEEISPVKVVTLYHARSGNKNIPAVLRTGDKVKTGQKLSLYADDAEYVISSVTGTISSISPYAGDFGRSYSAITIDIDHNDVLDDEFEKIIQNSSFESARDFLAGAPGNPTFGAFSDPEKNIQTIVVSGVDADLLIGTQQYIARTRLDVIKSGLDNLRKITGVEHIFMTVPAETMQTFGHLGAEVKSVSTTYPAALPQLVVKNVLGQVVPAGRTCEEVGICFFSAEAIASLGTAYSSGRIPVTKILTFISKDGNKRLIKTRIGTPVRDILETYGVSINDEDRLIFGGPMRGSAIYSLEHPVQPDTDAIMIIDRKRAAYASEYPCINCGECVRVCPANIPINLLVRFLEAGQYEEGADNYDLHSCIECGLCSFVCVSKIPIFQYIKLAKYELERAKTSEAMNA